MNLQFGGIDTQKDVWTLLVMILISVSITSMVTVVKKQEKPLPRLKSANVPEHLTR